MEIIELLAIGVIVYIFSALSVITGIFYLQKTFFFEDLLETFIKNTASDEELLKSLYMIGGTLGQGAKSGLGISLPQGGASPKNLKQLGLQLLGGFLEGMLKNSPLPSTPETPTPHQAQAILDKKLSDKW